MLHSTKASRKDGVSSTPLPLLQQKQKQKRVVTFLISFVFLLLLAVEFFLPHTGQSIDCLSVRSSVRPSIVATVACSTLNV